MAVGQGRGARVDRRQKRDTAMENERAISVGRSDTGDGGRGDSARKARTSVAREDRVDDTEG